MTQFKNARKLNLLRYSHAFLFIFLNIGAYQENFAQKGDSESSLRLGPASYSKLNHEWYRYVRHFRSEHHFSASSGVSFVKWNIGNLGTLESQQYNNRGYFFSFQYSFHLPIEAGFGYFVGSSLGYHYELKNKNYEFVPADGVAFPGLLFGLTHNFSPSWRFGAGFDAHAERYEGIKEQDGKGEENKPKSTEIYVTAEIIDTFFFIDYFVELPWGIRTEYHNRRSTYRRPLSPQGFATDAEISKQEKWIGMGFVYHLL